ncbi:MAG TPA: FdhF/YdeP family oxidoreductase [Arenimonas sp.]|uniref:FdhF/YdeP family oxidoreductase n=1 Tax=Arenimonas sp. TaxID=1872635 RepID=UPI002B688309|nr:FdhF/YdeP family oxidoreductase [Arenimonas sp.]HMB57096.1 FdhF/YdeP family oxidoreductase [Arenimonas sp.]
MSSKIKKYTGPAGGWDSLISSFRALREQGVVGRGAATMLKANQPEGFDCPGCAWPDKNHHSTFEFCENGVKAVAAESTKRRVTADFFAQHGVEALARQDDHYLEAQGRLTEPMFYDGSDDHYRPIAWDEAFAVIAAELNALDHPDQALFYTSGRTSNEAAFLYQLFVREFGSNNLPDCSNMCHEPSGVAMVEQIGIGKGTVTLADFQKAEAIFIFGQNPGSNHPRMLGELREAAKRGCRIVAFNPLRERGLERFANPQDPFEMLTGTSTEIAAYYYQLRIGGDLAAIKGLAKAVMETGGLDEAFIAEHTQGFAAFREDVLAEDWTTIEAESGLTRTQIEQAAAVYSASKATIFCWGMGITQHKHSVATIQLLIDLLLLKGNIGRPGAGACPVRGHSNVQGDRTMGIYEKPGDDFLDRLGAAFDFSPPRKHGHDVVAAIAAMASGECRVFFAMGGNFAVATPDSERTAAALRRCDLTVHVATKLNRSHLVHGRRALILPCLGRTEIDRQAMGVQGVTVEDSMSCVHVSTGMNVPASEHLLSEPAIVARLAAATLMQSKTPWLWLIGDYDRIRDKIAEVVEGFADFNARVHVPGGFYLGNSAGERRWRTAAGRAIFFPHPIPRTQAPGDAALLNLTTLRSHDQYNTTIYGFEDRYRGVSGERRVCFINAGDLQRLGFQAGQWVDIVSVWHDGERIAKRFLLVEYDIPVGCVASYYPETNGLVPLDSVADRAGTPTSKSIPVRLQLSKAIALQLATEAN